MDVTVLQLVTVFSEQIMVVMLLAEEVLVEELLDEELRVEVLVELLLVVLVLAGQPVTVGAQLITVLHQVLRMMLVVS